MEWYSDHITASYPNRCEDMVLVMLLPVYLNSYYKGHSYLNGDKLMYHRVAEEVSVGGYILLSHVKAIHVYK